jgi:serine/threonine protein kinase
MTNGAPDAYDWFRMDAPRRPTPAEIDVGTVLDRYEIVRHVARGGMGSIWLARFEGKHGFTKHVAVKTIVPELAENPQFHAMFLEEARISAKLAHANVAQVLDVGEHGSIVYIVFEWVDGRSLEQLCRAAEARGGQIPLPLILRALADACAGLHAAHILADADGKPLGVVHRDVTPDNVLVSENGFAKVIDFGIAKARDRVAVETRSGFVKGTPQYMSPEAACKRAVDRRSDVWSLGAILFRALRGRPAFPDHRGLLDYIDGITRLPSLPDEVPPAVRAIVARALSVSPADRFQSADEMRSALERAIHTIGATPADVRNAASDLVGAASRPFHRDGDRAQPDDALGANAGPFESTKLAIPSLPSRDQAQTSSRTLVAAQASLEREKAPSPSSAGSMHRLTLALILAAFMTAVAVALSFCG